MRIVCIDFETANFHYSSPCSMGIAVIEDGKITDKREWFIKPHASRRFFSAKNISIHGITSDRVALSPQFDTVFAELAPYRENSVWAAHYAVFDMSVLKSTLGLYNLEIPPISYTCSRNIARKIWKLPSYRLNDVCNFLNYEFCHHDALCDAAACAEIIIAGMRKMELFNPGEFLSGLGMNFSSLGDVKIKEW